MENYDFHPHPSFDPFAFTEEDKKEEKPFAPGSLFSPAPLFSNGKKKEKNPFQALKDDILRSFKEWLDDLEEEEFFEIQEESLEQKEEPDLFAFFGELQAMRQDSKLQAKVNQGIREKLESLTKRLKDDLDGHNRSMEDVQRNMMQQGPKIRREAKKEALQELIRLGEAVDRCVENLSCEKLPFLLTPNRKKKINTDLAERTKMLKSQANEAFARMKLEAVARIDDMFNATTMRAIATVSTGKKTGTVVEIFKQGYSCDGELLNIAEVKVEK